LKCSTNEEEAATFWSLACDWLAAKGEVLYGCPMGIQLAIQHV